MPELRTGMAAVAYDENLYIIAGEGPEGVSGKVFLYSLEENKWTTVSPKPIPVTDMAGVVIGEKIYIPGGITKEGLPTNILEIYDPRRDKWETGSPLPKSLSAYALANFEGKLYLFGGWDGEQAQENIFIYDPVLNYWYEGTPIPSPRYYLGAVALKEKIIVLGGNDGEDISNQMWTYYPSRDLNGDSPWEVFIDMPEGRSDFGVASIYDSIYMFGGISDTKLSDNQAEWALIGDNWITLSVNQDYWQQRVELVPMGSLLIIIDPSEALSETRLWSYEAFYYSVYIPITQ
jgi:N-acetylneuraminic acid mutarotase